MSELKRSFSAILGAMGEVRPVIRPYLNGALIVLIVVLIVRDVHPDWGADNWPWWGSALTYAVAAAYLLFDFWVQREIRRQQGNENSPNGETPS